MVFAEPGNPTHFVARSLESMNLAVDPAKKELSQRNSFRLPSEVLQQASPPSFSAEPAAPGP